ncbi:hypothetical protein SDC9_91449 [bioreactor metagenome]|uniref:Tail sheath protein C-terminal domain-containing protein n=1 Tax=bioreactor metagenome TaxID=1076179 RepID=A0A644ZWH8_9ZZZZ
MDGVTLGSYTVVTSDDVNDVATGLRLAINNLTSTTGYAAAGSAAEVTLTAPAGKGASINGGSHLAFASTGTGAATVTQFSSGVSSVLKPIHYIISEYFRIQPKGELWVMLCEDPGTWADFSEVQTLKTASNGAIRQYLFFASSLCEVDADYVTAMQTEMATLESEYAYASSLLALDMSSVTDLTTLPDLRALSAPKVSVAIGQGGTGSVGAEIAAVCGYSVTNAGAVLGLMSLAKVHEDIGYIKKYDISGTELTVPAMANGTLLSAISNGALTSLNEKGYIFGMSEIGITGTFVNDSNCAVAVTSDYAYIEDNRAIDKACRAVRAALLPELKGPLYPDATTGKLSAGTVKYFEELGNTAIAQMIKDGELAGGQTLINADQDVVTTSNLNITVELVKVATARAITVSIGFVLKLS